MSDRAICVMAFIKGVHPDDVANIVGQSTDMIHPNASLWMWIKGQYNHGFLSGDTWKTAFALEKQGWHVRNEIAWSCKIADPSPENRLKRGYETLIHVVHNQSYYYDRTMGMGKSIELLQMREGNAGVRSGIVGSGYIAKIESSPFMTVVEKANAINALKEVRVEMDRGNISDFRMVIRGMHKVTKSVAEKIDKEGFYLRVTKSHSIPIDDFWTSFSNETNAFIPRDMMLSILRLSSPLGGVVLDLFPSDLVASTTLNSGRIYIAKEMDKYTVTKPSVGLFGLQEGHEKTHKEVIADANIGIAR